MRQPAIRTIDAKEHRSVTRRCMLGLLTIAWTILASQAAFGMEPEQGGKALRRGTSPVWVDFESESATVPEKQLERNDYSDRHDSIYTDSGMSSWERWLENLWGAGNGNGDWSDFFSWIRAIWRYLVFAFLAVMLFTLLFFLFRSEMFRAFVGRRGPQFVDEDIEQQRAKVTDLPFEIEQPLLGLRAQAERFRNLGEYSKAIVYLYSYLLVELDHANCIRLERGKTNGIYMRELIPWNALSIYMKPAVRLFELAYFGRGVIDRGSFEGLWNKVAAFEATLSQIRAGKLSEDSSVSLYADSLPAASVTGVANEGGSR